MTSRQVRFSHFSGGCGVLGTSRCGWRNLATSALELALDLRASDHKGDLIMPIRIADDLMALEVDVMVVASARFSQYAAG